MTSLLVVFISMIILLLMKLHKNRFITGLVALLFVFQLGNGSAVVLAQENQDDLALEAELAQEGNWWEEAVIGGDANDLDSDGLFTDEEAVYGTDVNNADTDGDGFFDGEEVAAGYDPAQANGARLVENGQKQDDAVQNNDNKEADNADNKEVLDDVQADAETIDEQIEEDDWWEEVAPAADANDSDADGLTNIDEEKYGTDPENVDSDNDGYFDNEEVVAGFDPAKAGGAKLAKKDEVKQEVVKKDALKTESAKKETVQKTEVKTEVKTTEDIVLPVCSINDPLKDCDNDGVNNKQEQSLGINPSLADTDSDGYSDGQELVFGTDPLTYGLVKKIILTPLANVSEPITLKTTTPVVDDTPATSETTETAPVTDTSSTQITELPADTTLPTAEPEPTMTTSDSSSSTLAPEPTTTTSDSSTTLAPEPTTDSSSTASPTTSTNTTKTTTKTTIPST